MKLFLIIFALLFGVLNFSAFASDDDDHGHAHHGQHKPHEEGDHDEAEEHGHAGIHGGYFADADDKLHFEFILEQNGYLKVYLYDGEANPIKTTGYPARWVLAPDSPYPLKGDFKEVDGGEFYWVQFPPHNSEIIHFQIEVQKKGEWLSLEYYLPVGLQSS